MTFTDKQFKALEPYEERFREAVIGKWARNPGKDGLTLIHGIYTDATGDKSLPLKFSCYRCIFNILSACGSRYLADKAEREKTETPKVSVKMPRQRKTRKDNAV